MANIMAGKPFPKLRRLQERIQDFFDSKIRLPQNKQFRWKDKYLKRVECPKRGNINKKGARSLTK